MIKKTSIKACKQKENNVILSLSKKSAFISSARKADSNKSSNKISNKISNKTSNKKSTKKNPIVREEYYDIPYTYNDTVIKVMAQNPYTLFVYWDISNSYREYLLKKYGDYFFNDTRPFLTIKNEDNNNYFEIEVNDFANNWYISVEDTRCKYEIKLIRRSISEYTHIENNYLEIATSNIVEAPNDHVLLDELPDKVNFFNVKTREYSQIDITKFNGMKNPLYKSIHDLYNSYKDIKKETRDSSSSNYKPF